MTSSKEIEIPDKERAAIAFYHAELEKVVLEAHERFGAEINVLNVTSEEVERRRRFPKRLIQVGVEAEAFVDAACQRLTHIHNVMLDKFNKQVFRAINPPQVYHEVSYASLTINPATSVHKLNDFYSDMLDNLRLFIQCTTSRGAKQKAMQQLDVLENLNIDEHRLVFDSGQSYQLYIYGEEGKPQRCNVNHATFLLGSDDEVIPEVIRQRPRRKRSDIKNRKIALYFEGGTIDNDGKRQVIRPITIYCK